MTPKPSPTSTATIVEQASRPWSPCPTCWGQRRIWTRVQAPNGEGAILVAETCSGCLGIGEVVR